MKIAGDAGADVVAQVVVQSIAAMAGRALRSAVEELTAALDSLRARNGERLRRIEGFQVGDQVAHLLVARFMPVERSQ